MQIASITTNEQGEYEYATEEDYLEQTLDIIIQKEGFERKNISYEIDKAEIMSDILLNEFEKGTKEKTRIFGTIRNSKKGDPVKDASITFSIEGTQIAAITSDEMGRYEYTAEEDYTGQTLDYVIQKEGFIRQDISHEIDRFEIESDFLMDEIEIKIKGKICDETDSPLDNASVSFSIGGSTIDLNSDKDGSFSFTIGQQFLNQTIGYEASKEGFKIKRGKLTLIEDLKCINLTKDILIDNGSNKINWIKVAAIGITLAGIAIILLLIILVDKPPELSTDPDPMDFDFVPGTSAQTFSIWNDGDGTLEWDVHSDRDWIIVSPDTGIVSTITGTEFNTVSVSVNSAGMDPGRHTGSITVESNGGIETGRVSLHVPVEEPTEEPPRIHNFNADPEIFDNEEGETRLSWEVTGATSVTIDGVGPVDVSEGSIYRGVEQTTTFILRATNDAGVSDVRTTIVYVEGEPVDEPVIHYFITNPEIISSGEKSTLQWDVSGVETVTIDNGIGEIGGIGNTDVFLDETTIFILTAENDAGKDAKPVTVEVLQPELSVYPSTLELNFEIDPKSIRADYTKTFSIHNSGEGNLHWSIDIIPRLKITSNPITYLYEVEWATIKPTKGDLKKGEWETITVTIDTRNLGSGNYNKQININSNGGTVKGNINLDLYKLPDKVLI